MRSRRTGAHKSTVTLHRCTPRRMDSRPAPSCGQPMPCSAPVCARVTSLGQLASKLAPTPLAFPTLSAGTGLVATALVARPTPTACSPEDVTPQLMHWLRGADCDIQAAFEGGKASGWAGEAGPLSPPPSTYTILTTCCSNGSKRFASVACRFQTFAMASSRHVLSQGSFPDLPTPVDAQRLYINASEVLGVGRQLPCQALDAAASVVASGYAHLLDAAACHMTGGLGAGEGKVYLVLRGEACMWGFCQAASTGWRALPALA